MSEESEPEHVTRAVMPLTQARSQKLRRLGDVCADPVTLDVLCERVAEGESVRELAQHWDVPAGRLWGWLREDAGRWERYVAAKQQWALGLAEEMVGIADHASEQTGRDRLRIETRWKLAGAFVPEIFARADHGAGGKTQVNVIVQRQTPPRGTAPHLTAEAGATTVPEESTTANVDDLT